VKVNVNFNRETYKLELMFEGTTMQEAYDIGRVTGALNLLHVVPRATFNDDGLPILTLTVDCSPKTSKTDGVTISTDEQTEAIAVLIAQFERLEKRVEQLEKRA